VASKELPNAVRAEIERTEESLGECGRVLVRASGTEPVIRVLVEAQDESVAKDACATIATLVRAELG